MCIEVLCPNCCGGKKGFGAVAPTRGLWHVHWPSKLHIVYTKCVCSSEDFPSVFIPENITKSSNRSLQIFTAWDNSAPSGQSFFKFHIWECFENLQRNFILL